MLKESTTLLVFVVVGLLLVGLLVSYDDVILALVMIPFSNLLTLNVVFAPDVDISKISSNQILNCLHGGGCPEGVTYVNDDTGLVEEREIIPDNPQPIQDFSPETVGFPDWYDVVTGKEKVGYWVTSDNSTVEISENNDVINSNVGALSFINLNTVVNNAVLVFIIIVLSLSAVLVVLYFKLKRKHKK